MAEDRRAAELSNQFMIQAVRARVRRLRNALAYRRWKRVAVGHESYLDSTVQILGARNVRIGRNCQLGEMSWLNVNHRIDDEIRIDIGDCCLIGRRNFISSGARIEFGDFLLTGADCAFLGADHVTDDPCRPYILAGATEAGAMVVEPNCWFGMGATVIGECRIGRGSIIGAHTMVLSDVPPFSLVVGNPGRVIRRFDFNQRRWVAAGEIKAESDLNIPSLEAYRAMLNELNDNISHPRLASGWRMGSTY